jgi:hypothetical protein
MTGFPRDFLRGGIAMRVLLALVKSCAVPCLILVSAGCGQVADDLPREAVRGKVTVDGEPLAKGAIRFRTSKSATGNVMEAGDLIRNGEYQIARNEGPVPGIYTVVITEEVEASPGGGDLPGPRPKLKPGKIPEKYTRKNSLSAEIKTGQSDPIDFDLKTK